MRGDVFSSSLKFKILAVLLIISAGGFGWQLSANFLNKDTVISHSSLTLKDEQLTKLAQAISVQILAQQNLGSGVIIAQEGSTYTVITNAHVLRAGKAPYQIKTFDQKIYQAEIITNIKFFDDDLALLQFSSPNFPYKVAKLGDSSTLQIGEEVWGVGFPFSLKSPRQLTIKKGQIALILDKPLEDGYQIGYTSEIEKGMSGGAVLNRRGEVIAINGLSNESLWDAPDYYADGSQPSQSLQDLIKHSSFGIPIEKVIQKLPDHD